MKKHKIKDFLDGKISVRCCTNYQMKKLLEECDKRDIIWKNGEKATSYEPSLPVLTISKNTPKVITQGVGFLVENPVIDFDYIVFEKTSNHYQIIIDCDGDTTTAKMVINGKEVKSAKAKRNPHDKFNWKLAADLVFGRLWGENKTTFKEVKRRAKLGEYIRIVNAWNPEGYKNNDILLVSDVDVDNDAYAVVPGKTLPVFVSAREYVVLEGYKPSK